MPLQTWAIIVGQSLNEKHEIVLRPFEAHLYGPLKFQTLDVVPYDSGASIMRDLVERLDRTCSSD